MDENFAPTPGYGTAAAFDTSTLASAPYQTYNSPPPQPTGMEPQNLKEAESAVAAALRFQGARAFSEAIQKGASPDQALLAFGPKMFYGSPTGFAGAMRQLRPTPQFRPSVENIGGLQIAHLGPNRSQVVQPPKDPRATAIAQLNRDRLKHSYNMAERALFPEDQARFQKEAEQQYMGLTGKGGAPADAAGGGGGGVILRRKSDKKTFRYTGNPDEVPADQFEVIE